MRLNIRYVASIVGMSGAIAAVFMMPREGEKFKAYPDGIGVWTICRGHTEGVYEGMIATAEQCDKWYIEDVAIATRAYERLVHVEHHPNVKAASISFIFNAGAGNFATSTLRKKLNAGDRVGACNQFPRWKYAGGKDCNIRANKCFGIITRRQEEKELCLENTLSVCPDFNFADFSGCLQSSQLASGQL